MFYDIHKIFFPIWYAALVSEHKQNTHKASTIMLNRGQDIDFQAMIKSLIILLSLLLSLSLIEWSYASSACVGCGGENSGSRAAGA